MRSYYYILFLITGLCSTGCIESIQFDTNDMDSQIVVFTEIQPNTPFQLKVSSSAIINSNQEISYPDDAEISISNEGSILDDNFMFRDSDGCYIGLEAKELVPYTLNVSIPGMNIVPVNAHTTIPASQKFQDILSSQYETTDFDENLSLHSFWLEISIDNSNVLGTEYFQIIPQRRSVRIDPLTGEEVYSNEFDELVIEEIIADDNAVEILSHKSGIYIDGTILQSKSFMIHLETKFPLLNDTDIFEYVYLTLKTLTYETFKYNKIKAKQLASQDAPLIEPIITFSNINYGIGLFGACNSMVDSVKIK